MAEELAKEVDFFSIGTNDLIQYMLAVDRGNEMISDMFQEFHPAVVRAIKKVVDAAHNNNKKVSLCGEMASDPFAVSLLLGLGIDELSVVPSLFPEIKQIIRVIKISEVKKLINVLMKYSTEKEVKTEIISYYNKNVKPKLIN